MLGWQEVLPGHSQATVVWGSSLRTRDTESQDHLCGRRPLGSWSQTCDPTSPCHLDHGIQCHAQSLNTSSDGDCTTLLGSPFQCFITPSVKKSLLRSNRNLPWHILRLRGMHKGFRTPLRLGMPDPMGAPWHRAWLDWSRAVSLWKQGQGALPLSTPWGILGAVQAPTRNDSSPEEGLGLPRHVGGRQ